MEYMISTNTTNQAEGNVLQRRCKAWRQANESKIQKGVHVVPTDSERLKMLVTISEGSPSEIRCEAGFIRSPFQNVNYRFWWERTTSPAGWDEQLKRELFKTEWEIK